MGRNMGRRTKGLTMHRVLFVRVHMFQNVEETLNEFRRTRLVNRKVGGCTEWEGGRMHGMGRRIGRRTSGLSLCAALHLRGSRGFRQLRKH